LKFGGSEDRGRERERIKGQMGQSRSEQARESERERARESDRARERMQGRERTLKFGGSRARGSQREKIRG